MSEKIIIAGGTGALGKALTQHWQDTDIEVVVLTRSAKPSHHNVRYVQWDAQTLGEWTRELEGAKTVVNLVGKSVNCRYTEANKAEIIRSRVDATAAIGQAIQQATVPPKVWVNAGSAAIFGDAGDEVKTESSPVGSGFSPEVCKRWETTFDQYDTPHTRKVFLRIGIVIQSKEGILKPFINLAKYGLGGKIGNGEQYLSWIHEADFLRLVDYSIEHENLSGIVHASSPLPIKNKEFMKAIRQAVGRRFGLPNYTWSTKIGAWLLGTEAELVLSGRRVVSEILEKEGFSFQYPEFSNGLHNLALK